MAVPAITNELRESLLAKPDLALLMQEIEQILEDERQKRGEYYSLVHENIKAEFINGEIVYQSPVKRKHWLVSINLSSLLHTYVKANRLGEVGVEKVLVSLTRNDYEPDICFFTAEKAKDFRADQMHFPAPDFVVEILSDSTEQIDREVKFQDYAAHGVQEYWMIDPTQQIVEQYFAEDKMFYLHQKLVETGTIKSKIIQGFEVAIQDLFQ